MPSLPQWFNSFFNRPQEPAPACKIYAYYGRGAAIVVQPANGMSEEEFRQLDGPIVFTRSEIISGGDTNTSWNGLLRIDFGNLDRVVWEPL